MMIKLEWLGYCIVKKLRQYVKLFSSNTGTSQTDGQNCYINIARQLLMHDKNCTRQLITIHWKNQSLCKYSAIRNTYINSIRHFPTIARHDCRGSAGNITSFLRFIWRQVNKFTFTHTKSSHKTSVPINCHTSVNKFTYAKLHWIVNIRAVN